MARQISTNRGSAWDEVRFRIGEVLRFGRGRATVTAGVAESAGPATALAAAVAGTGVESEADTGAGTGVGSEADTGADTA